MWRDDESDDDAEIPQQVKDRHALHALEAVYRGIEEAYRGFSCDGSAECCGFPGGREPHLFPVELLRLEKALAKEGRAVPPKRSDGVCPLLSADGKRCTVYADRPFGCRTFFCQRVKGPGALPNAKINALSARLTRLSDERDEGANPRRLSELLEEL